jgi:hypothetical protein
MKALLLALSGCVLGGLTVFAAVVDRAGGQVAPGPVPIVSGNELEPVAPGDTVESVVRAYFAYRVASKTKTEFSRSLGRATWEKYGPQILETLEVLPTFQVVDSTAVLTRFKAGNQTIKEAQWLRFVDGKWLIVGNPVYMMVNNVRQPDNPATRPYVAEKKKVDELFAKVSDWLADAQPLWE